MYWHSLVVLLEVDLSITFIYWYNASQRKIKALNKLIQVTPRLSGLFLVDYLLLDYFFG